MSIPIETQLVGVCLSHGARAVDACVSVGLDVSHLSDPRCREVLRAVLATHAAGRPVDVGTVGETLRTSGRLDALGGPVAATQLLARYLDAPSVLSVESHAQTLIALARQRATIEACKRAASEGEQGTRSPDEYVAWAADTVQRAGEAPERSRLTSISDVTHARGLELLAQWQGRRDPWGLRGPHETLHGITHGFGAGQVTVVAADTGGGKSAYACQVATTIATRERHGAGCGVLYVTLEMPARELVDRMIVQQSGVPLRDVLRGPRLADRSLDYEAIGRIEDAQRDIALLPLDVDDAGHSAHTLLASARRSALRMRARDAALSLVVVDHVHLLRHARETRGSSLAEAIGETCSAIKRMAIDLDVHVMVLAQYRREALTRGGRPLATDIRDASAIEQIADKILLIHRPIVRNPDRARASEREQREAEIIVAKHRSGSCGTVPMEFEQTRVIFVEGGDA